jgi:hypothetical protein
MNDEQLVDRLRADMARATAAHHLDPGAADAALADLDAHIHRSRPVKASRSTVRARGSWLVGAAAVVVVAAAALAYALARPGSSRQQAAAAPGCHAEVRTTALPAWARGGFTRGASAPYVTGDHRRIVAILFAEPLYSPPAKDRFNKILWVARDGSSAPLVIHARLAGTHTAVTRVLPHGAGPSYVNLPAAGCWQLVLRWGDARDALDLQYTARPGR